LSGVLSQHIDELKANRVAECLGHPGDPLRLRLANRWVDDRIAAPLTGGALLLRRKLEVRSHRLMFID
jgi:hypothetical protein